MEEEANVRRLVRRGPEEGFWKFEGLDWRGLVLVLRWSRVSRRLYMEVGGDLHVEI